MTNVAAGIVHDQSVVINLRQRMKRGPGAGMAADTIGGGAGFTNRQAFKGAV